MSEPKRYPEGLTEEQWMARRSQQVYDRAVEIAEALPPRDRRGPQGALLDVLVVHKRASYCVHHEDRGYSLDHRIREIGFGAAVLGTRARRIVIDMESFFEVMRDDTLHGRRTRDWFYTSLMCRLEPSGEMVLV